VYRSEGLKNFFSGLFLMVLGVGACIMAYRLGFGDINSPGPGLIPFGIAALMGLMSLGMVIRSLRGGIREYQERKVFQEIGWKKLILVICALLGYGIALNTFGVFICTFLLMTLLLGVFDRKKWWVILVTSILIVIATYLIFVILLGCEFPQGIFRDIIGI
jgi:hypothetical protein